MWRALAEKARKIQVLVIAILHRLKSYVDRWFHEKPDHDYSLTHNRRFSWWSWHRQFWGLREQSSFQSPGLLGKRLREFRVDDQTEEGLDTIPNSHFWVILLWSNGFGFHCLLYISGIFLQNNAPSFSLFLSHTNFDHFSTLFFKKEERQVRHLQVVSSWIMPIKENSIENHSIKKKKKLGRLERQVLSLRLFST